MVDVSTHIIIDKAIEQVSDYAANPDNAPEWYVNILFAEWKSPKPLKEGSQIAFKARFMGKQLSYTYQIMEYKPNIKLVMRTAEGPFPMETTYSWNAVSDNQTLMTLRNTGKPSGFSKVLAPFMTFMMKRANNKDLKNIKRILEVS